MTNKPQDLAALAADTNTKIIRADQYVACPEFESFCMNALRALRAEMRARDAERGAWADDLRIELDRDEERDAVEHEGIERRLEKIESVVREIAGDAGCSYHGRCPRCVLTRQHIFETFGWSEFGPSLGDDATPEPLQSGAEQALGVSPSPGSEPANTPPCVKPPEVLVASAEDARSSSAAGGSPALARSKEWWLERAAREEGFTVGAGSPAPDVEGLLAQFQEQVAKPMAAAAQRLSGSPAPIDWRERAMEAVQRAASDPGSDFGIGYVQGFVSGAREGEAAGYERGRHEDAREIQRLVDEVNVSDREIAAKDREIAELDAARDSAWQVAARIADTNNTEILRLRAGWNAAAERAEIFREVLAAKGEASVGTPTAPPSPAGETDAKWEKREDADFNAWWKRCNSPRAYRFSERDAWLARARRAREAEARAGRIEEAGKEVVAEGTGLSNTRHLLLVASINKLHAAIEAKP